MKRESTLKYISKRLALGLAFVATYLLLALSGHVAHAADDGFRGLEISPASNSIELGNGESYSGEMSVRNSTDSDMKVKMSVGSYSIENSNYNSPNYDKESKYSVIRDWIRLDKTDFTLASGQSTIVTYTVVVPDNPPAGTQYATIFASTTPDDKPEGSGITATSRIGMVLSAYMKDGETIEQASIQNEKIAGYQPTSPLKASFSVKNEGNVGADVTYSMTVKSAINGTEVYKSDTESSSIYPESTRNFNINWDGVGIGFYNVEMNINLNGTNHTIKKLVCTIPIWIIILIIVAIISLIAYAVINYRMRKDAKTANSSRGAKAKKSTKKSSKK